MKEEDNILKKAGTENPFKVPENYFEELTSKIMQDLPEQPAAVQSETHKVSRWEKVKPLLYLAATFVGIAFIIQSAMFFSHEPAETEPNAVIAASEEVTEEEYIDYILDASMMDDYEMYVYLSEAN